MVVVTLGLTAVLCLAFNSTRLIGVVFAVILFCLYPLFITALLITGSITYFLINHYKRSIENAIRKLFAGRR